MKYIIREKNTGKIISFNEIPTGVELPASFIAKGTELVYYEWNEADSGKYYLPGSLLITRPVLTDQTRFDIPVSNKYQTLFDIVAGTVINGMTADEDDSFEIEPSVKGTYLYEITPPWPFQKQTVEVNVI